MATNRKQSKTSKASALNSTDFELILKDFRLVNLKCERYLTPEEAPKGSFSLEANSEFVKIPKAESENSPPLPVVITYNLTLIGTKVSQAKGPKKPKEKKNEKSFSIDLSVEGFFELSGKDHLTEQDLSNYKCMTAAIQQLHLLGVDRIRTIAAELGYKGVRPSLGAPKFELESGVTPV
ncbi:MAG TPA: hypothetical protein VJ577_17460 [Burkholderiaceae bacterium]|nr:hypothetical protein [Burkholderiaceae bacterium]